MERNAIRNSFVEKLDVTNLKYDIKRLTAELNYLKSKTSIFEQTIKAQQAALDEMLVTPQSLRSREGIYR